MERINRPPHPPIQPVHLLFNREKTDYANIPHVITKRPHVFPKKLTDLYLTAVVQVGCMQTVKNRN